MTNGNTTIGLVMAMSTFGERLRLLREEKELSQDALGKVFNLSQSIIAYYEKDKKQPSQKTLKQMATLFNVSTDFLLGETDQRQATTTKVDLLETLENPDMYLSAGGRPLTQEQRLNILRTLNQDNPLTGFTKLPIVGTIRAGLPILTESHITGYLDVPAKTQADFAVQIRGDSMILAGVHEGDYAVCRQTDLAYTGQMVVAAVKDVDWGGTIKYFVQANGNKILRAANPDYEDIHLGPEDRIVGVVVALFKDPPGMHTYEELVTAVAGRNGEWAALAQTAANYGLRPKEIEKLVELFAHMVKQVKD